MTDEALKRCVIKHLSTDNNTPRRFQALNAIVELMPLPEGWWEARLGGLDELDLKQAVRSILDDLTIQGLLEVHAGSGDYERSYRLRDGSREGNSDAMANVNNEGSIGAQAYVRPQTFEESLDEEEQRLLQMLASERAHTGDGIISVFGAFERFRIPFPSQWIDGALTKLETADFVRFGPQLADQFRGPWVTLTEQGLRAADELNRRSGVTDAVDLLLSRQASQGSPSAPESQRSSGPPDAIVSLDHSDPKYLAVKEGLASLYEQVRQDNEVGSTASERDRILRSLSAAKELWASTELQFLQIKIGVVMAVEDASRALVVIGKAVGQSILADMIKEYIKSKTGWTP